MSVSEERRNLPPQFARTVRPVLTHALTTKNKNKTKNKPVGQKHKTKQCKKYSKAKRETEHGWWKTHDLQIRPGQHENIIHMWHDQTILSLSYVFELSTFPVRGIKKRRALLMKQTTLQIANHVTQTQAWERKGHSQSMIQHCQQVCNKTTSIPSVQHWPHQKFRKIVNQYWKEIPVSTYSQSTFI